MKDIKVGEYVRTTRGIAKIKEIQTVQTRMNGKDDIIYKIDKPYIGLSLEDIINHDFDIIKLIEAGDYVNGIRVDNINKHYFVMYDNGGDIRVPICTAKKEIKSIVTHEQFENMKYVVGDK